MTQPMSDLKQLAQEAGLFTHKELQLELGLFAQLVAKQAVEAEREACAKECDSLKLAGEAGALLCAKAIRARSQA